MSKKSTTSTKRKTKPTESAKSAPKRKKRKETEEEYWERMMDDSPEDTPYDEEFWGMPEEELIRQTEVCPPSSTATQKFDNDVAPKVEPFSRRRHSK